MTYSVANSSGNLVVTFTHAATDTITKDVSMGAVIKAAAVTNAGAVNSNDIYVTLQKMIYTSTDGHYQYQLNGTNAIIFKYLDIETNIIVPSQIDGKSVTDIGSFAFNEKSLTTVTIPDNVKIDTYAFVNNNITSITIGSNVTIGDYFLDGNPSNTNFRSAYSAGQAGTYIGSQTGPWTTVNSATFTAVTIDTQTYSVASIIISVNGIDSDSTFDIRKISFTSPINKYTLAGFYESTGDINTSAGGAYNYNGSNNQLIIALTDADATEIGTIAWYSEADTLSAAAGWNVSYGVEADEVMPGISITWVP